MAFRKSLLPAVNRFAAGIGVSPFAIRLVVVSQRLVAHLEHGQSVEEIARGQWPGDERLVRVGDADVPLEANGSVRTSGFAKAAT